MTEFTAMHVPQGVTPTVDEAHLERVASDSGWVSRVLLGAAQALNTLDYHGDDGEGTVQARAVLRNAFTDWDTVLALLNLQRPPVTQSQD
jgi:hypothetical protein